MGLLALGTPLDWPEAKKQAQLVRKWGIKQLLEIWTKAKAKERDALLWGDEVEYLVVIYSEHNPKVLLSLRQADILEALASNKELSEGASDPTSGETMPIFHPEFGRFMLETTPGKPWGIDFKELLRVESDMKLRRRIAKAHMLPHEYPITLTTFPRLGSPGGFSEPEYPLSGPKLRSQFVPDEIANPHIRFPTLAANIRSRRGRKVQVNVPVFRDTKTPQPWKDPTVNYGLRQWPEDDDVRNDAAPDNFIHMDAMAFGMGSCCLQITFQARDITEGRTMYDQLSPLGPIMLALTAATVIYKGFLADTDVRWNQISAAVDDRTPEELGEKTLENDRWRIPKSRYASNSTYISTDARLRPEYMDPNLVVDPEIRQQLLDGGMDGRLATHFAHLFIRDPIVIFDEDLAQLDMDKSDHFENIQSTNWQHMRFKPPPAESNIGWRVEFRPMEIQMTDFENAAFSVFMVLVTRTILSFNLNFYIPIAKVDENMETAHARDAVLGRKFHFRKNPFPPAKPSGGRGGGSGGGGSNDGNPSGTNSPTSPLSRSVTPPLGPVEDEYQLMTINEIMNGTAYARGTQAKRDNNFKKRQSTGEARTEADSDGDDFPGLVPLVETYLDSMNLDVETRCRLGTYLDLIRRRASGELWTAAKWIRNFVASHPGYHQDSVVSEAVTKDLVGAVVAIGEREQSGAGFKGLDIPDFDKLMNGFRSTG